MSMQTDEEIKAKSSEEEAEKDIFAHLYICSRNPPRPNRLPENDKYIYKK